MPSYHHLIPDTQLYATVTDMYGVRMVSITNTRTKTCVTMDYDDWVTFTHEASHVIDKAVRTRR